MSTPKRLLDSDPDSQVAALLRAGLTEQAPPDLPHHILVGLRAGTAASAVVSAAAAGTRATAAGTGAASAGTGASVSAVVVKWLAIGMVSGGVLGAGATSVFSPRVVVSRRPPTHASMPAPPSSAPPTRAPESLANDQQAPPEAAPPATSAAPTSARVARSVEDPGATEATAAGQLGREVRLIDAARRALAAGDAGKALQALSEYQALAVTGVLEREALVLRIESLLKVGDVQQAEQLGRAYLQAFPGDAHAPRLRTLLHLESAPSGSNGSVGDMNNGRSPQP